MKKLKSLCIRLFKFLRHLVLNPRFLLCFGLAWLITNGWSYILFGLGMLFDISWMKAVAGAYMAALYTGKNFDFGYRFWSAPLDFPERQKNRGTVKIVKTRGRRRGR